MSGEAWDLDYHPKSSLKPSTAYAGRQTSLTSIGSDGTGKPSSSSSSSQHQQQPTAADLGLSREKLGLGGKGRRGSATPGEMTPSGSLSPKGSNLSEMFKNRKAVGFADPSSSPSGGGGAGTTSHTKHPVSAQEGFFGTGGKKKSKRRASADGSGASEEAYRELEAVRGKTGSDDDDNDDQKAPGVGNGLDDGDDDLDDGASGVSANTRDTSSTSAMRKLSGLPCGLTMPLIMVGMICVPLIFLVVYQSLPLDEAVRGQQFLSDHKDFMNAMLDSCTFLSRERALSSGLLVFPSNSSFYPVIAGSLPSNRTNATGKFREAMALMVNSDASERDKIMTEIQQLSDHVTNVRARVDARTITGPAMRSELTEVIEHAFSILLLLTHDSRSVDYLEARLFLFILLRRVTNSLDHVGATGIALLSRGETGHDLTNLMEMFAKTNQIERDAYTIGLAAWPKLIDVIRAGETGSYEMFTLIYTVLALNATPSVWPFAVPLSKWMNSTFSYNIETEKLQRGLANDLLAGEPLFQQAQLEGIKMLVAVVCCIIAVSVVIWLSNRESNKMKETLKKTNELKNAVQKFVPRAQLKAMGIRNIMQVRGGMQTEISQTMLFSDIRNFTGLSEQMSNIELFEWLQNYISRMTKVTGQERGYIDKFIGDAVFAVFPQPTNGVKAAIQMQVVTDQLNLELVAGKQTQMLAIGVGLHLGVVVAGVFGDSSRLSVTLIAPDVNLASRLESLTKTFGCKIMLSMSVVDQIDVSQYQLRPLGSIQVGGSSTTIGIFDLFQSDNIALKDYKVKTLFDWQEAMKCLVEREDAQGALSIFRALIETARESNVRDISAEKFAKGISSHEIASGGTLAFTKDGEFRQATVQASPAAAGKSPSFGGKSVSSFGGSSVHIPALEQKKEESLPLCKKCQKRPVSGAGRSFCKQCLADFAGKKESGGGSKNNSRSNSPTASAAAAAASGSSFGGPLTHGNDSSSSLPPPPLERRDTLGGGGTSSIAHAVSEEEGGGREGEPSTPPDLSEGRN